MEKEDNREILVSKRAGHMETPVNNGINPAKCHYVGMVSKHGALPLFQQGNDASDPGQKNGRLPMN
jgi:hypothetical protein